MSAILLLNVDKELPVAPSLYDANDLKIISVYSDMLEKLKRIKLKRTNLGEFWYIVGCEAYGSPFERFTVSKNNCPEIYQMQCTVSQWLYGVVNDLKQRSFRTLLMYVIHCCLIDFDPDKVIYKKLAMEDIIKDDACDLEYYVVNEVV